jgi:hypothetical protein
MKEAIQEPQKSKWCIAGALIAPFIVVSICLILSLWPSDKFYEYSSAIGLALSILVGAIFVGKLPISITKRVGILLAYIPTLILALFYYSIVFVCWLFELCL